MEAVEGDEAGVAADEEAAQREDVRHQEARRERKVRRVAEIR